MLTLTLTLTLPLNLTRRDFWPTLALEWAMWAPLDIANFALVPVPMRHQLLLVSSQE